MKPLKLKVLSLFKGFVLALIFSVFLQASLASAIDIESQADLEAIGVVVDGETPSPLDGDYVVTDSFIVGAATGDTYVIDTFTGTFNGGGNTISGLTRPLFDVIGVVDNPHTKEDETNTAGIENFILTSAAGVSGNGALANTLNLGSTIDNVSFTGDLTGIDDVGGLVGISFGAITNSSATGVVTGNSYVGGLVGSQEGSSTITNSYANGAVYGFYTVGGLVGRSRSEITNSYANSAVDGTIAVGGLVGDSTVTGTITNNSYATGVVTGNSYVGGLVGYLAGAITDSYATGVVTGNSYVGGLVGESTLTSTIDYSIAVGTVTGTNSVGGLVGSSAGAINYSAATGGIFGGTDVGGLVGNSFGAITNSYATGEVNEGNYAGGLVGSLNSTSTITNSYATGAVGDVISNNDNVGGLVGSSAGAITNSSATGIVIGNNNVGGLVGWESNGIVINSYAAGEVVGNYYVGGLVGNSSASIINSYATGVVVGNGLVGGLVGYLYEDNEGNIGTISNSYATGDVIGVNSVGSLVGFTDLNTIIENSSGYFEATINGEAVDLYLRVEPLPYILDIINTPLGEGFSPAFEVNTSINYGLPYLASLELSYDVVEEDTEETPSFSLRSYYTQAAKSLDKALTPFGFKSNFSAHPTLGFQALEQNQSKLPTAIQLFEVSEYQNSRILLNKADGLQLSISSYYKEAVEIWTQGSKGEYLYLGLVEFDKDGMAILPTLKFETANTYQLLMIKAVDKLSEKPNLEAQLGQITINVF